MLVVSVYGLDCQPYNKNWGEVTWETCSLRKWLNTDFYNTAFSNNEKEDIPSVTIANKDNPYYGTDGGNNTTDKIFCLSLEEMEAYFGGYSYYNSETTFGYNQNLICTPTQYAVIQGVSAPIITDYYYFHDSLGLMNYGYTIDVIGRNGCWWWLRSPGAYSGDVCTVVYDGSAGARSTTGATEDSEGGGITAVRPAMYIMRK